MNAINLDLEKNDRVLNIGREYIPAGERSLRKLILEVFTSAGGGSDLENREILGEAVFWSLGELINNANKANNRWALLRSSLYKKIKNDNPDTEDEKLYAEIDYAIEHNQTDLLKKYNLQNIDLTSTILKMIETYQINSFALSEKFKKRIDVTLRIKEKSGMNYLNINVINNSAITIIDKQRVEYNLEKIKEDLINTGSNPFQAAVQLYDKAEDHEGGGFGAGLRSIILFLKEGYNPFFSEIKYSRLIQYRSAGNSTIFTIELPIP